METNYKMIMEKIERANNNKITPKYMTEANIK